MNYDKMSFRVVESDSNSQTGAETIFNYTQNGPNLTGTYSGGVIADGQIVGTVDGDGHIDMRYQHRNVRGEMFSGTCQSKPAKTDAGKLQLHETWQWTGGESGAGTSILEQTKPPKLVGSYWDKVGDMTLAGLAFALLFCIVSIIAIFTLEKIAIIDIFFGWEDVALRSDLFGIGDMLMFFGVMLFKITVVTAIAAFVGNFILKLFRLID